MDHEQERRDWGLVRYADDFAVLCRPQEEAPTVRAWLRPWTAAAGLSLQPTQRRLVHAAEEGPDFLGWAVGSGQTWLRKKSLQKLQEQLHLRTQRTHGRGLSEVIAKVNPMLRGWHGHFWDRHWAGLIKPDQRLGHRLRALLRKGEKRPGSGL